MAENNSHRIDLDPLPQTDVVRILMEQHREIRELCNAMSVTMSSDQKSVVFDNLRSLVAVHEAAEEAVVRPRTLLTAGEAVVDQRNAEERGLTQALADLESCDIDSTEFDDHFAEFAQAMDEHNNAEESEEFARLLQACDSLERGRIGAMFLQAERLAPAHPHPHLAGSPARQRVLAPFATLLDHAKDAFARVADGVDR